MSPIPGRRQAEREPGRTRVYIHVPARLRDRLYAEAAARRTSASLTCAEILTAALETTEPTPERTTSPHAS